MVDAFTANWHTHTFRCKHATGDASDYVRQAERVGVQTLGFTDHMPTPDSRWRSVRMDADELAGYREAVALAGRLNPDLRIFCGLECEYLPEWHAYFTEELLGRQGIEYLILGAHGFPVSGEWASTFSRQRANDPRLLHAYADYVIGSLATGLFRLLAHPDVFGFFHDCWDADTEVVARDIAQAARDAQVPLEINAYGFRKPPMQTPRGPRPAYPWAPFWDVAADAGAVAVINSDAHAPTDLSGAVDQAFALARRAGIRVVMPQDLDARNWA
jgi:histidinol-phosphatase (PHP family)